MLSERKQTILQSLIQEYVVSAHPVASSTLVRHYLPFLSSATIRNELNWLEGHGYVAQPYTSAGRMPTTVGYRTFVNSLLLRPRQLNTAGQHNAPLRHTGGSLTEAQQQGTTRNTLTALWRAADKMGALHEALGLLAEHNRCLMVFWAPQVIAAVIHRGLPLLLSQPEFAETGAALPIMQLLESNGDLVAIFEDVVETGGLHIKIGSEHRDAQLYEFSLVAMRFDCSHLAVTSMGSQGHGVKGKRHGVVALFGPTRMDYERAISSIHSLAQDLEQPSR